MGLVNQTACQDPLQCDFFSQRIVSKSGFRDVFDSVFLHVETRKVFINLATYKPDQAWMIQQDEAFSKYTRDENLACKNLMLNNDGKYSQPFLDALKALALRQSGLPKVPLTWT